VNHHEAKRPISLLTTLVSGLFVFALHRILT